MQKTDSPNRYVLIVPVRDEEDFLQNSLDCFVAQTILPVRCVIVDDGSTDATGAIADRAAENYDWITVVHRDDRGERKVGGGVVDAFYSGYDTLGDLEYDYVCKIDGDVTFEPTYFALLMEKFDADKRLGGASGKVWNPVEGGLKEERINDEMVSGALNFWRRQCWQDTGGYVREVMWDGIMYHRARMSNWKTQSFRDEGLNIIHHRLMGSSYKSIYHGRLRWGRGQWFMGAHPLYIIASGVFRMQERPYVIGGFLIVCGYILAGLRRMPQYGDRAFRQSLHRWQLKRLGLGWLTAAEPSAGEG